MKASTKTSGNIISRMQPLQRILISLIFSGITWFLIPENAGILLRAISLWIVFAFIYLTTCWIVLFTKPISEIRKTAAKDDGSKMIVFFMILLSSCGSMFAVLLLMISEKSQNSDSPLFLPATIFGMLLSWAMVHTLFTFHYAHIYYNNDEKDKMQYAGGLEFPGKNEEPDYIDFAYFSFVIGCTFQVSDVEISSKKIRRLALAHQLISFGLNTFVVALTINLVASLGQ